jgi:hypothetical protein
VQQAHANCCYRLEKGIYPGLRALRDASLPTATIFQKNQKASPFAKPIFGIPTFQFRSSELYAYYNVWIAIFSEVILGLA